MSRGDLLYLKKFTKEKEMKCMAFIMEQSLLLVYKNEDAVMALFDPIDYSFNFFDMNKSQFSCKALDDVKESPKFKSV